MSGQVDNSGDERRSRRDVMRLAVAGFAGALAAGALAPEGASANDGDPILLGVANSGTLRTDVASSTTGYTLRLTNSGHGSGLVAVAGSFGTGVDATSTAASFPAVAGYAPGPGPAIVGTVNVAPSAQSVDVGVQGTSGDGGGAGVLGENPGGGTGVVGQSDAGIGVRGFTTTGTALAAQVSGLGGVGLYVQGTSSFQSCGLATIKGTVASPKSSVRVTDVIVNANSLVLATIQSNNVPGTFVQSAVPDAELGRITINLNQEVSKGVKVAWFVIDPIPLV
jgi:hypothetical protein